MMPLKQARVARASVAKHTGLKLADAMAIWNADTLGAMLYPSLDEQECALDPGNDLAMNHHSPYGSPYQVRLHLVDREGKHKYVVEDNSPPSTNDSMASRIANRRLNRNRPPQNDTFKPVSHVRLAEHAADRSLAWNRRKYGAFFA